MLSIKYSLAIVLIGISWSVATFHGRKIHVQDVIIKITSDHFRCDHIACPHKADRCVVIKQTLPHDYSTLLRTNICYSKTNKILKQKLTHESTHGKKPIKELMDVQRHGLINILSSNDIDEEKFNKEFAKFEKDMSHSMGALNRDMKKMEHELEHMFS